MKMPKEKIDIEKHEKEILADFERGEFQSIQNVDEAMQFAKEAAEHYTKRDNRVNIRISKADLNMIRKVAMEEGLPYQTLLSSVVHKFAAGRLVDRTNAAA
jgi:predicted DNA binding CopG/RHH family protein